MIISLDELRLLFAVTLSTISEARRRWLQKQHSTSSTPTIIVTQARRFICDGDSSIVCDDSSIGCDDSSIGFDDSSIGIGSFYSSSNDGALSTTATALAKVAR